MKKFTHYMLIIVFLSSGIGFSMEVEEKEGSHDIELPEELQQYIMYHLASANTIREAYNNIYPFLVSKKSYLGDNDFLQTLIKFLYQKFIIPINTKDTPGQRAEKFKTVLAGKDLKEKYEYVRSALFLALSLKNNDYALELLKDLLSSFNDFEKTVAFVGSVYGVKKEKRGKLFQILKELISQEIINSIHTPLEWAIYHDNKQAINSLIEHGAEVNEVNALGITPLMIAVRNKDLNMVKHLIEKGANINAKTNNGFTALQLAVRNKDLNMAKYLIEQGADVNTKANDEYTVLHVAVRNKDLNMVKYLIEKSADVNTKAKNEFTALHLAVRQKDLGMVEYLVEQGADVNAKTNNEHTVLHVAVCNKDLNMVKHLIEKGANINAKDNNGFTALQLAVRNKDLNMAKYLIEQGADVNTKANDEHTVLHVAVRNKDLGVVKYLVEQGAFVDRNSVSLAQSKGYADIVDFLEQEINKKESGEPATKKQKIE